MEISQNGLGQLIIKSINQRTPFMLMVIGFIGLGLFIPLTYLLFRIVMPNTLWLFLSLSILFIFSGVIVLLKSENLIIVFDKEQKKGFFTHINTFTKKIRKKEILLEDILEIEVKYKNDPDIGVDYFVFLKLKNISVLLPIGRIIKSYTENNKLGGQAPEDIQTVASYLNTSINMHYETFITI